MKSTVKILKLEQKKMPQFLAIINVLIKICLRWNKKKVGLFYSIKYLKYTQELMLGSSKMEANFGLNLA